MVKGKKKKKMSIIWKRGKRENKKKGREVFK